MRVLLFLITLCVIGCTNYENELRQVYNDRQGILQMFRKISVFRDSKTQTAFLYTYDGNRKNEYIFDLKEGGYVFFRDSILFEPDTILNINRHQNPSYEYKLTHKLEFYLHKMDSLNIKEITSEFASQGITLKVYMKSKAILVYIDNPNSITNPEWTNYLKSMNKFDDHWYYTKEDN